MNSVHLWRAMGLSALLWCAAAQLPAGEARMKSGMIIQGAPKKMQSLTVTKYAVDNDEIRGFPIIMVQTGTSRYFLPERQIADGGLNLDSALAKMASFKIEQHRTGRKSLTVAVAGGFTEVEPFNEFGVRHVTLATARGAEDIFQGMTEITPEHIKLTGLSHHWDYGIATKSVPPQSVETILRKRAIEPENSTSRLSLVRFFIQAEYYPQAFAELAAIARDFPQLNEQATKVHQDLVQEFGRNVLRELNLRMEAGQYQLAEESLRHLAANQIGGTVLDETKKLQQTIDRRRETYAKVRSLLDDYAAKLDRLELQEKLAPLRSTVLDQLHPETLSRLDPFLKAEPDEQLSPGEKLALAYSGWVVGAADAVTELDQAIRLWDARFLIQDALRTESANERQLVYQEIRRVEGIGPETVRKMIAQLPPAVETPDAAPGKPVRIVVPGNERRTESVYWALLPIEYSPHHSYPLIITLRSPGRSPDQMLAWWGGTAESPGIAQRRGYIVIAPETLAQDQSEYHYDAATHQITLAALDDARRRFTIDSDRVYLSGHGLGADAAFDLGFSHPDVFAGVIPFCGVCEQYCKFYLENGYGSAWYVVGGELDRDVPKRNEQIFNKILSAGSKFDFLYCEFTQRGLEMYAEELPRIFDWMALHRRQPPPKVLKYESLRQSDHQFYWLSADELPRTVVLPRPQGANEPVLLMKIQGQINPGGDIGNIITISSPSKRHTIWIDPERVDLTRRVRIKVNQNQRFNQFIEQDFATTLDDFYQRGDRQRLYAAKLEL